MPRGKKDYGYIPKPDTFQKLTSRLPTYETVKAARKKADEADDGDGDGNRRKDKTPKKYKPGTVALRQIRYYQKSTDLLLPRANMWR